MTADWYTYAQAADELGVSVRTLLRRIRRGYIRPIRPGGGRPVITRKELEAFVAASERRDRVA